MITTHEAITDPVAFVHANPSIMDNETGGQSQVIAGPDFDVLIEPTLAKNQPNRPVRQEVSSFLGSLYLRSKAYVHLPGDKKYMLRWYPSSQALNTLSEEIGQHPGQDAFMFTTVPQEEISDTLYQHYLMRGILPQSGQGYLFDYERNNFTPGNLLLPPHVVQRTVRLAQSGSARIADIFQEMSALYNGVIRNYIRKHHDENAPLFRGDFIDDPHAIDHFRTFWETEQSPRQPQEFMAAIGEQIVGHTGRVRPYVRSLEASRDPDPPPPAKRKGMPHRHLL